MIKGVFDFHHATFLPKKLQFCVKHNMPGCQREDGAGLDCCLNDVLVALAVSFMDTLLDTWIPSNMQTFEGLMQWQESYLSNVIRL